MHRIVRVDASTCEELWRQFAEKARHPDVWHPWSNLSSYEEWKHYLQRGVGAFWTSQGERLAWLAAHKGGEVKGLVRVLQVPVFAWDKGDWGSADFRGEIQDLLYQADDRQVAIELIRASIAVLRDRGIDKVGASAWRPSQCEVLYQHGFRPFRRSVLLAWRTDHRLQVRSNADIRLHYVEPGEKKLVQEVFSSTWGFPVTVIPHMDIQKPLVALLDGRPVGAALLNKHTGNLDLGVQVTAEHRRRGIGSALVTEALAYYHRRGFDYMYVVRNLPVSGLEEADEVALRFYFATGATLLREYTGSRLLPCESAH